MSCRRQIEMIVLWAAFVIGVLVFLVGWVGAMYSMRDGWTLWNAIVCPIWMTLGIYIVIRSQLSIGNG